MTQTDIGIGHSLNRIVQAAMAEAFSIGELAQLSHSSYNQSATSIENGTLEEIEISYPVGYTSKKQPLLSPCTYKKQELIDRYAHLAHIQLPLNSVYQLTVNIECMHSELIRHIVLRYPAKLGSKRQLSVSEVLKASSLQEIHLAATNALLNKLAYKSPRDFAEHARNLLSVNLLECPAYHGYIEVKATRDVHIHSLGVANETYISKAGSHARVRLGERLPITQVYFLEAYEYCLKLIEWLEAELHEKWHSSEYEQRQSTAQADA